SFKARLYRRTQLVDSALILQCLQVPFGACESLVVYLLCIRKVSKALGLAKTPPASRRKRPPSATLRATGVTPGPPSPPLPGAPVSILLRAPGPWGCCVTTPGSGRLPIPACSPALVSCFFALLANRDARAALT